MYEITFGPSGITLPPWTAASRAAERAKSKLGTALPSAATPAIASAPQDAGPSGIIIDATLKFKRYL